MYGQDMQVSGLDLIREDMGFYQGHMLNMVEQFTDDEIATLEQEVTPAIEKLLMHAALAHASQDLTNWCRTRAEEQGADKAEWEVVLEKLPDVLSIQDKMGSIMSEINAMTDPYKRAQKALSEWTKRFNNWKYGVSSWDPSWTQEDMESLLTPEYCRCSPAFRRDQDTRFFSTLKKMKAELQACRYDGNVLSGLWEKWFSLRNESQAILASVSSGTQKAIWRSYFSVMDGEEIGSELEHPYFCVCNTQEVDEQQAMDQSINELMDELAISHVLEMSAEDGQESRGSGFWDYKEKNGYVHVEDKDEINSMLEYADQRLA